MTFRNVLSVLGLLMLVAFFVIRITMRVDRPQNQNPTLIAPAYELDNGVSPQEIGLSHIGDFWTWFSTNENQIADLAHSDANAAIDMIDAELKKIENEFVIEIGTGMNPYEFIISAGGIREHFPAVDETVRQAPSLSRWKVIALRQPKPGYTSASYNGVTLNHSDVKIIADYSISPIEVDFYIDGLQSSNDQKIGALFHLLDNLIGERNVATKIGGMEFRPGTEAPTGCQALKTLEFLK